MNTRCEGSSIFTAPFQVTSLHCLGRLASLQCLFKVCWQWKVTTLMQSVFRQSHAKKLRLGLWCAGLRAGHPERIPLSAGGGVHRVGDEAHQRLSVLAEHAAVLVRRGVQRAGAHHRRRALRHGPLFLQEVLVRAPVLGRPPHSQGFMQAVLDAKVSSSGSHSRASSCLHRYWDSRTVLL